jgi:hypothetical protein
MNTATRTLQLEADVTSSPSNSAVKRGQTITVEGVRSGDEAELARMGYKQELRCFRFNLCAFNLRNL